MATIRQTSDMVAIFNSETFEQVFVKARPVEASIKMSSKVMTHPLEDGSSVSDHQIFDLIGVDISFLLSTDDYVSVYQSIKTAYEKSILFTIQTKTDVYENMLIQQMPRKESANMFNGVGLNISFIEFKKIKATISRGIGTPRHSKDAKNQNSGKQQGTQKQNSSLLYRITK